jgi:uncharacterized damage-inducible protein DinB
MEALKEQYQLVQASREVVLNYCETIPAEELNKAHEAFNGASMMYMLLHVANTYLFWLKRFAAGVEFEYFNGDNTKDIKAVRKVFEDVDKTVHLFLNSHTERDTAIEGEIFWLKKNMSFSVLEMFTHVVTHEFHHKGQLMSMSRMLGYTPPDADVIRFE